MREIKFRMWNGNNMVDLKSTTQFAILPELKIDGLFIPFKDEYKIMQYTGLKDKNGKEIYEGDILKSEFVNSNFAIEWNNDVSCYDWYVLTKNKKEGASLVKSIEEAPAKATKPFSKIVEVIGNIYENPELLK